MPWIADCGQSQAVHLLPSINQYPTLFFLSVSLRKSLHCPQPVWGIHGWRDHCSQPTRMMSKMDLANPRRRFACKKEARTLWPRAAWWRHAGEAVWERKPRCVHRSLPRGPRGRFSSQLGLLGSREECHCMERLLAQELCFALDGSVLLGSNSWALKSYYISRLGLTHDETWSVFLFFSFSFPTRDQIHPLAVEAQSPNH